MERKPTDINGRLFTALKWFWIGILIVMRVTARRYHRSPATSLKDLVANHCITVVFNETDRDHEATSSGPPFFCDLWLEIKAQKITLEVIHSSRL